MPCMSVCLPACLRAYVPAQGANQPAISTTVLLALQGFAGPWAFEVLMGVFVFVLGGAMSFLFFGECLYATRRANK